MKKILSLILVLAFSVPLWGQGITYPPDSSSVLGFGQGIQGMTVQRIHVENAGSGDVDLFTVPANSRAMAILTWYNSAGTTTTFFLEAKISSTYYRVGNTSTTATNVATSTGYAGLILEAAQSFSINTSQAGLNVFGTAYIFPNTGPLKSTLVTSLGNGDNTLYTCPSGKTCRVVLGNAQFFGSANASLSPAVVNASGGTLSYTVNIVSSGGSPGTANKATPATSVNNGVLTPFGSIMNWALAAGDFININATGASAGVAWVTTYEQ